MYGKLKVLFVFGILLLNIRCGSKIYDYEYVVWIENNTNDTLHFKCGTENTNLLAREHSFRDFILLPNDTLLQGDNGFYGFGVMDGIAPVPFFFDQHEVSLDTVHIYRNDTLKVVWSYLDKFDNEVETHNFFNYASWKTWRIGLSGDPETTSGVIMFTIEKNDLK